MEHDYHIRELRPGASEEIEFVAKGMRQTLIEVLGEERGASMYSMAFLLQRVRYHVDSEEVVAAVYLATDRSGALKGHTMVRIDDDGSGTELGLFATTYVMPAARNHGIASRLLDRGEQWMRDQQMSIAATYTDKENRKLQALYIGRGYDMSPMPNDFVKLAKVL